jgi:Tfp pilus assembly protein PilE
MQPKKLSEYLQSKLGDPGSFLQTEIMAIYSTEHFERIALERRQDAKVSEAAKELKRAHSEKTAANRAVFLEQRADLEAHHAAERTKLKGAWKQRTAQRTQAYEAQSIKRQRSDALLDQYDISAKPPAQDRSERAGVLKSKYALDHAQAARPKAAEQDNSRSADQDDDS